MYRFYINNTDDEYHCLELGREFLPDDGFEVIPYSGVSLNGLLTGKSFFVDSGMSSDRDAVKREMYGLLSDITGIRPPWGTLTGVRPLKPALEIAKRSSVEEMRSVMSHRYLISPEKASLLADIASYQLENVKGDPWEKASVYAGIPFCPTRCAYCSFASNVAPPEARAAYLADLIKETVYAGGLAKEHGTKIESVYIGGGTPTTLTADQLTELISAVTGSFGIDPETIEFTVEAGRPDTITEDKLSAMRALGISRISINPQTINDNVLREIGRKHTSEQFFNAFELARKCGFDNINTDLIAGLPTDTLESFVNSLDSIRALSPECVTIHTLCMKRASTLTNIGTTLNREDAETAGKMLEYTQKSLTLDEYIPYYMYRQSRMVGNLENVGWSKKGFESLYNVYVMDETHSILACGSGGVTKLKNNETDYLERIFNFKYPYEYVDRFNELIERKSSIMRFYGK